MFKAPLRYRGRAVSSQSQPYGQALGSSLFCQGYEMPQDAGNAGHPSLPASRSMVILSIPQSTAWVIPSRHLVKADPLGAETNAPVAKIQGHGLPKGRRQRQGIAGTVS